MDYDLFQSDDDEDILSAYMQVTQQPPLQETALQNISDYAEAGATDVILAEDEEELNVLPEFNCSGRDTIKTQTDFPSDGFMRNGYAQPALLPRSRLDKLCFDFELGQLKGSAVMRYLHGEACKNIQKLCGAVTGQQQLQSKTTTGLWYQLRQQVTYFYYLLLHDELAGNEEMAWQLVAPAVLQLRELLNCCLDADAWRVLYFAENSKGNECPAPAYHLYHGALEWRLLDLCVQRKYQTPQAEVEDRLSYQTQLERTLDDLILCAAHHYRSKNTAELLHTSAFMCRCNKELWLWLMHQQTDQQDVDSVFWPLFHRSMQRHKTQFEGMASHCEFYAWLRLSLARLSAYGRDGQHLLPVRGLLAAEHLQTGSLLKQFLACQPTEQQRRVYICLLAPLQLQWDSQPDTDVICQLWECLHRSLHCNFQLQLEQLPMICASGSAYLERYTILLARPQLEDLNLTSFTLFALLLGKTLQQLSTLGHRAGNQAQKLLGRIFSKFSVPKLLALNESGIHHVIELFLCLLLSYSEFGELAPKVRDMLLCLQLDKLPPARRLLAAKGHMAVLLLHAQRRQPFGDYVTKFLSQLAAVHNDTDVASCFAGILQAIFELADDFSCGEPLLLGSWLKHYVEHSAQASQDRVWQAFHALAQKLRDSAGGTTHLAMCEALQQHVLPHLRVQFVNGYSSWLPKLAADFVALDKEKRLLELLLQGAEPANTAASAQLVLHVLEEQSHAQMGRPHAVAVPASLIMQVWIKSLVLLTPQHEAVLALTPHVCQLEEFRSLGLDAGALENREPLCVFFGALGKRAQQQEALHVRMQLSHRLHAYVAHFEQWLPAAGDRPELGTRFFNFLAIVIYNCASLAYVRSKPTCFFHLAMSRFLLTTQLQTGSTPEPRVVQSVHKIFPVLLQGIGRLPYRTDTYLTRTLEQLLQLWTPRFGFSTNVKLVARPYATLLQADANGELVLYVLQQLAGHFLAVHRMQANTHIGLILTVMQQLFAGLTDDGSGESQLLTLLRGLHTPLLEHVMFVGELEPSRLQVLNVYRLLTNLGIFWRSQVARDLCATDIRSLAEKHLAYRTYYYFQMLIKLAELVPQLILPLYGFIRDQAHQVEQKRGSGEDVGIRKCLQRLQEVLQKGKPN